MVQMRAGHVGVHQDAHDEAGKGGLRQRFGKDQVGQRIGLGTTVFAAVHQAKKASLTHFAQHLTRHFAGLFPFHAKGFDLALKKALHLVAQGLVFGQVVDVVHGRSLEGLNGGSQCGHVSRPPKICRAAKSASRCSSTWPWFMQ